MLRAEAQLPIRFQNGAAQFGELKAGFALTSLPLARLSALTSIPLEGRLSARGRFQGPLSDVNSTVALDLLRPGALAGATDRLDPICVQPASGIPGPCH